LQAFPGVSHGASRSRKSLIKLENSFDLEQEVLDSNPNEEPFRRSQLAV
jgi:hypothetical protein